MFGVIRVNYNCVIVIRWDRVARRNRCNKGGLFGGIRVNYDCVIVIWWDRVARSNTFIYIHCCLCYYEVIREENGVYGGIGLRAAITYMFPFRELCWFSLWYLYMNY